MTRTQWLWMQASVSLMAAAAAALRLAAHNAESAEDTPDLSEAEVASS